jgi:hypothetical protein
MNQNLARDLTVKNAFQALVLVLFGLSSFSSCNDTGFKGSGATAKPAAKPPVPVNTSANAVTADAPEIAISQVADVVENGDGTRTERFIGRSIIKTETLVDIIFVVDTSGSMDTEKSFLEQNMSAFVNLLSGDTRLKAQTFMIGKGFQFPAMDPTRFSVVNFTVDSHNAYGVVKKFFTSPPVGTLPLRPDATKEIVVVTDDNADMSAGEFVKYLDGAKATLGNVHVNGFIGLANSAENSWCKIVNVGTQYQSVGLHPSYGGTMYDLCSPDWKIMLTKLAEKIISASAQVEFPLGAKVDPGVEMHVFVNDIELASDYWTYSESRNSIVIDPAHTPLEGDSLSITYKVPGQ